MIEKLLKAPTYIVSYLMNVIYRLGFKRLGKRSRVIKPLRLDGMKYVEIGEDVVVRKNGWLCALPEIDDTVITIKDGCYIGHMFHCVATRSVTIEEKVLIADKVFISDNTHSYKDIKTPIIDQPVVHKKPVTIGKGAWLAENVCIVAANVGENAIVAANSVVVKDVEPYTIVSGIPARPIMKYNFETLKWSKI